MYHLATAQFIKEFYEKNKFLISYFNFKQYINRKKFIIKIVAFFEHLYLERNTFEKNPINKQKKPKKSSKISLSRLRTGLNKGEMINYFFKFCSENVSSTRYRTTSYFCCTGSVSENKSGDFRYAMLHIVNNLIFFSLKKVIFYLLRNLCKCTKIIVAFHHCIKKKYFLGVDDFYTQFSSKKKGKKRHV